MESYLHHFFKDVIESIYNSWRVVSFFQFNFQDDMMLSIKQFNHSCFLGTFNEKKKEKKSLAKKKAISR